MGHKQIGAHCLRMLPMATGLAMRCIITSDDTEPENYGLSENQTADLCHCRHNNKTT